MQVRVIFQVEIGVLPGRFLGAFERLLDSFSEVFWDEWVVLVLFGEAAG
jgi:hypothetical protein